MNITPRVKLATQKKFLPHPSRIPLHRALRWVPKDGDLNSVEPPLNVFLTQNAFVRMCAHAGSDLDNEVGGWMAGKYCRDSLYGTPFIVIDTILPAIHTNQDAAHLTFTGDTQIALHNHLEEHFPDKVFLGWYHTHPRMGVFFSHWDAWLHQNFFPEAWQVALVIEPHRSVGGFFIRQADGSLDQRAYFGFYELTNSSQRSVVFWRNLQPAPQFNDETEEVLSK
ncbi:MAG: Mov34/MPN/PAD-1 family protein [Anaerolineaceae bacterium]|nr:Mov34/MPN/PAD-1 family protein [Anaerolineaceae bacterium]